MDDLAIKVSNVSKDFVLPHERITTVKGIFTTGLLRRTIKSKERQHALRDISLEIHKGEFFGIVGRNGSGKSTLLKILAGIYQPTNGEVKIDGRLVPFIELGVGFNPELSGRDNVYLNGAMLGFSKKEVDRMYDDIVSFAELEEFMDKKLKNYSSGMQVRLAFSMATRANADILLVDEVLAVGDESFQRKCFRYFKRLKRDKKTVIFVTHDMSAVREFCDRAILINDSKLAFSGSSEDVAREYSELFMTDEGTIESINKKRWGSGAAKLEDINVKLVNDYIEVKTSIKVKKPLDRLIYGMHIVGDDGTTLVATNNRLLEKPDLKDLTKDMTVSVGWEMLNIFNDGRYYVTLTLVNDELEAIDWYNEVAAFTVKRRQRSVTPIIPPIKVEVSIGGR